jgi:hypothetical protein
VGQRNVGTWVISVWAPTDRLHTLVKAQFTSYAARADDRGGVPNLKFNFAFDGKKAASHVSCVGLVGDREQMFRQDA